METIYIAVIELIVMYASYAWAPAASKLGMRKMLDTLQRSVALKTRLTYRTVSLHSTLILSRLLFLNIRAKKTAWLYKVKREKQLEDKFTNRKLPEKSMDFCKLPHPVHTSKIGFGSIEDLDLTSMEQSPLSGRTFILTVAKLKTKSMPR
ncbi:hypothetical protein EVAR_7707_1 [Eumeta japonica]|uniref:Uncharacterized protein n=1 Tax=Eumeta variegata TaxID=151549 RepID=A0A4C1TIB6_EUMVA|nr:hypothetical protein EVAR_7707_1 [Eumeta japonica]